MFSATNPLQGFDVDRSQPVSGQVYARLRSEIVSLNLKPGHVLSESELSKWLGVSRTPIRQALKKLEEEGFVQSVPHLGTFVSLLDMNTLIESQFIRESLECSLTRRAATHMDDAFRSSLLTILEKQKEALSADEFERFYLLDQDFHKLICSFSRLTGIWKTVELVTAHLNRVRRLSLPLPFVPSEVIGQHQGIVDALIDGDEDAAEQAMRVHLRNILKVIPEIRERNDQLFKKK